MSVKVVQGDLFDSSAQTLVNTVNCVGAMGKGIEILGKEIVESDLLKEKIESV